MEGAWLCCGAPSGAASAIEAVHSLRKAPFSREKEQARRGQSDRPARPVGNLRQGGRCSAIEGARLTRKETGSYLTLPDGRAAPPPRRFPKVTRKATRGCIHHGRTLGRPCALRALRFASPA